MKPLPCNESSPAAAPQESCQRYCLTRPVAVTERDALDALLPMRGDHQVRIVAEMERMVLVETTPSRAKSWSDNHANVWTWTEERRARMALR